MFQPYPADGALFLSSRLFGPGLQQVPPVSPFFLTRCHFERVVHLSAGLHALRRAMGGSQQPSDRQLKGAVSITLQDLQWAMSSVKPSAMREVSVDVPKVIAPLTLALPVLLGSRSPKMVPSKFLEMGEKRSRLQLFWVRE